MDFQWLKRYMPRGLYGRAALILLLPIVTLQLVVSVVFIQRHYEDVTRQMTRSLAFEIRLLQREIANAANLADAQQRLNQLKGPLGIGVSLPAGDGVSEDRKSFFDLSGRMVIRTLRAEISGVTEVDLLSNPHQMMLFLDTRFGPLKLSFGRYRVAVSNPHQFLVLVIFVSGLMTIVAFLYLRNQLRPIKRLARAAEDFGKGRVVEYRPAGAIEVRAAGRAFLDMRGRIERHIEQRTLMLSGVSHDLRTPLTRLKLGLSMLDHAPDVADMQRDIADMERLLDGFLAFARGDVLDDLEGLDPIALLRQVVDDSIRAGGQVTLSSITGTGQAMLRPMAIQRVLENLINNALRYGNQAHASVVITERSVKFCIEDDGPGISEDQRETAMRPFARLDQSRNQDKGSGVGLGLSIAKDIAQRHGGVLRLGDSTELGGLQVELILPR